MGNSLPLPCVCRHCHDEADDTAEAGAKKRRRRKQQRPADYCSQNARAARPTHVVPVVDTTPEDGDGRGREQQEAARPECRVERAGYGEDSGVRVKIVMKRKDIAQLVARLEQRGAEERDANAAGMEEVGVELAGCYGNDGAGVTMSPCRDAWRPRLSIIPEHY